MEFSPKQTQPEYMRQMSALGLKFNGSQVQWVIFYFDVDGCDLTPLLLTTNVISLPTFLWVPVHFKR